MSLLPVRFQHIADGDVPRPLGPPLRLIKAHMQDLQEPKRDDFEALSHEIDEKTGEKLPAVRVGEAGTFTYMTFRETAKGIHDDLDKMLRRAAENMLVAHPPVVLARGLGGSLAPEIRVKDALHRSWRDSASGETVTEIQVKARAALEQMNEQRLAYTQQMLTNAREVKDYEPGAVTRALMTADTSGVAKSPTAR